MKNRLEFQKEKYLNKYGSGKWKINSPVNKKFNTVVVIPAIAEYENIQTLIDSIIKNDDTYFSETLILFVINNLCSSSVKIKENNRKTIELLKKNIRVLKESKLSINFVDASTAGNELDEKNGGVGLARKIGMDLALTLFDYDKQNKKLLLCLDGDCTVKENYITSIREYFNKSNAKAAYVNFNHSKIEAGESEEAIINYEIFLRYYVLGLIYAKSPFAYHSIGSTMICDAESYIKIGGMNKRKAAEDFYFMEKLSKITKIHKIDTTTVYPSGRGSWRVPFGTGQRVNRFLSNEQDEFVLYSPDSFNILKKWVEIFHADGIYSSSKYLDSANSISKGLHAFLMGNNFSENWEKILKNSKSDLQIQKQKIIWFDGFKTLKLIHYLRDTNYPLVNMFDALDRMFEMVGYNCDFQRGNENIPPISIQKKYLNALREIA